MQAPLMPANFYTVSLCSTSFTVPKRYERLEYTGCGAFSSVARAQDRERKGLRVAIKKLARPFQDIEHARRAYRELHLLSSVSHPNLISLLDAFSPQLHTGEELQDVYIVMPHMECDLRTLLVDKGRLKCNEARKVIRGVLRGLRYLHSAGILHRDLKPENVALGREGDLKILDFGLARAAAGPGMTGYVCTRNYRSPEVLLACDYGPPADLWSVGCILAEAVLGRLLFPALTHLHLLRDICQLVGKPADNAAGWVLPEASNYIALLDTASMPEFNQVFAHLRRQQRGQVTCDLLRQLLTFDPALRITAEAALSHPALAKKQLLLEAAAGLPIDISSVEAGEQATDLTQCRALIKEKLLSLSQPAAIV